MSVLPDMRQVQGTSQQWGVLLSAYLKVRFRPQGGLSPGGGEGFVDVFGGVEVEAQPREVGAQGERGEIWIAHADHTQQA